MVAMVKPSITWPTAREWRRCGTSEAATSAAMPKYAPCGRPERKRAADHGAEARRQRGEEGVAECEHGHQGQKLRAPGEPGTEHGNQRSTQHHAEGA